MGGDQGCQIFLSLNRKSGVAISPKIAYLVFPRMCGAVVFGINRKVLTVEFDKNEEEVLNQKIFLSDNNRYFFIFIDNYQ